MVKEISVGKKLPMFKLKDQGGIIHDSSSLIGKRNILLSFHPLAFTPVCSTQMKDLEKNYSFFDKRETSIFGVSIDHDPTKKAWAKELKITKTRLLCDFWPHGEYAKKLGLFFRQFGFSRRAVVIANKKGIVSFVKTYPIHKLPPIKELMDVVSKLED